MTDWNEPIWQTAQDCWHTWWYEGEGLEIEVHRSTIPIKVLASGTGIQGGSVFFKFRTWDRYEESGRGMPGMAELRMTPDPPPPDDCGRRDAAMETSFDVVGDRLHLNTFLGPRQSVAYRACETTLPKAVDARGVPDAVTARFSARELFDPRQRAVTFRGRRTYDETRDHGGGRRRVTGSVTWTLTLRRVGGSARPRR